MVLTVPATWAGRSLENMVRGAVVLSGVSGSIWFGEGELKFRDGHPFGRVSWRTNPFYLVTGRLGVTVRTKGPEVDLSGNFRIGWDGFRIMNTTATCSPSLLAAFYSPLALVEPRGKIVVTIANFLLNKSTLDGKVTALWQDAGVGLSNVKPLGDYRLQVTAAGRIVALTVDTDRGSLNVAGHGRWQPLDGGQLQFRGTVKAIERQQELEPLLMLVGRESGPNGRLLNVQAVIN